MRRLTAAFGFAVFVLGTLLTSEANAQTTADIIRGRVTGPDSLPVANASVLAISIAGGIEKTARTNRDGRFSITYPNGEGDYWIVVAAIGYTQKRFQLKRIADEEILIADTRLAPATLERVEIIAQGARQTATRNDNTGDVSGTDRTVSSGNVAAADAGNLAALAASLPGFQLIPGLDGNPDLFSALGLSPDQNNSTLNGALGGADLPRDANVGTGVSTSSWDVSRGGFSGAQISITTRPGNNFITRRASGQFQAPQLQWTDRVGQDVGSEFLRLSLGGSLSGPIKFNRNYYSTSYQLDRRSSDSPHLFNTNPAGLNAAGIAPDSVGRLRDILQGLNVPAGVSRIPGSRIQTLLRAQGVADLSPASATSGHAFQLSALANWQHTGAAMSSGNSLLSTPTTNQETSSATAQFVGRHTNYFWDKIITESWLSAGFTSSRTEPYFDYPSGGVRVSSALDDGTTRVSQASFGGNVGGPSENSSTTVGFRNQMRWVSLNNRHSYKLTTELSQVWYSSERAPNRFGRFSYLSLADLEAGRPSSYSRQLAPITEEGGQFTGALSLGDAWRPRVNVQVQYGLRMDVNRFTTKPDFNPAVESAFGVRNDYVPDRVYFSPRAGFSWTYGTAAQIPFQQGFVSGPRATVRGGVGVFQNVSGPNLLSGALNSTGLPGSSRQLVCSGPATPVPDWDLYRSNPFATPQECADGSSPFASSLPSVTLFDKSYVQPRSVRANLNWSGATLDNRFNTNVSATYSVNLNQPGNVDLNFNPTQRFTLDNEGGRPVYVQASNIDRFTGNIASRADRVSPDFASVNSRRSDLQSHTSQFTIGVSPLTMNPTRFRWNASYTLMYNRDEYRGFSSTAGNPLEKTWGVSEGSRHQVGVTLTYNFWDYVTVSWNGIGAVSGQRFTPTVAGDINGDGAWGNDRAFIFNPVSSDPVVAAGMSALLRSGSSTARECLSSQLGRVASRNSCVGPWQLNPGSLSLNIEPYRLRLPTRAGFSLQISNPIAAADLLLHGASNTRGWGQPKFADRNLLYVRGFDPATQRYVYEVNQRFGATSAQQQSNRSPVVVTASLSYDLGPTRDWQSLKMQLNRGRSQPGTRMTEAQAKSYVTSTITNPMARILQTAEMINLSRRQADSLATLSRGFTLALDSIWTPVARHLGGLDSTYRDSDVHQRFVLAREAAVNYLIKVAPDVKGLLTPNQRRRLSPGLANLLEPRYLERVRAGTVSAGGGFETMIFR